MAAAEDGRFVHVLVDAPLAEEQDDGRGGHMQHKWIAFPAQNPRDDGMGIFMREEREGMRKPDLEDQAEGEKERVTLDKG
ncbi:hypothetical protein AA101099_2516 [Neoasaia chiangmaiensis NBRC 101099]|nr:hypothetical protein AA101099_2516 [Neoasaia chiangmaiensis NBRC 101099]GEN14408.1 hypothetical protein NCH01_08390 [Neoasaia chiangmaiensis]